MDNVLIQNTEYIYKLVGNIIITTFVKLNRLDQQMLIKYLYKVTMLVGYYFKNDNFVNQITLNNNRDIFSFLVLLMPFYKLDESKNLTDLEIIFSDKENKAKKYESSYYIDHKNTKIEEYFENNLIAIHNTLKTTNNNILINWTNIFPYTIEELGNNKIKNNFQQMLNDQSFKVIDELIFDIKTDNKNFIDYEKDKFLLGYNSLLGTVKKFMYDDIKTIKWMIYDVEYIDKKIYPNIIILCEILQIKSLNKSYDKLTDEEKNNLNNTWNSLVNGKIDENYNYIKSIVMFYARWVNFNNINIEKRCLNAFKPKYGFDEKEEMDLVDEKDNEFTKMCTIMIIKDIKFENLYSYLFDSFQQFQYTWYGYSCVDKEKNILSPKSFYDSYTTNNFLKINNNIYITPKNVYNFMKSLIHRQYNGEYTAFNSYSYSGLIKEEKDIFIRRLNKLEQNWFNIPKNLRNIYPGLPGNKIREVNKEILDLMFNSLFSQIICETLIYNGMLTYFEFNPSNTININKYGNGYNFLNNKKINEHYDYEKTVTNTRWYNNFGANWVAQIQIYHHFINQRTIFITGGTGAGKSTVAPFMLLYATKIIKYKNNGKIFVTQPRTKPERGNAERIAQQLGVPIDKTNDINYLQYKDKEMNVTDNYYHPCLRMYTDGLLYMTIINNYLFKKKDVDGELSDKNDFDMLLVDEAHEHNTYMDLILTLAKFAIYINNQVGLGIISATMDHDELIYRKYYEIIDDNWIYPLNTNYEFSPKLNYDKNLLDRRVHLSLPFGKTNYKIVENKNFIGQKEITILQHILKTTNTGDVLIFEPGENEIKKLVKEINNSTPSNIIAIPFYTSLEPTVKDELVNNIDNDKIRRNFHLPKDTDINYYYNVPNDKKVSLGTYTRFIIVATNIAEASITINTLEYVIDTGIQKTSVFDPKTNQKKLIITYIAKSNQVQRAGRVGRTKPGTVYFTYDPSILSEKVSYKISNEDIRNYMLNLMTTTSVPYLTKTYLENITDTNFKFLKNQYFVLNKLYNNKRKKTNTTINFPFSDGRYGTDTLIDNNGNFYIIHPNQDDFERNNELVIEKRTNNFVNKIHPIIQYYSDLKLIQHNKLSHFGILVLRFKDYLLTENNNISLLLLNMLSFKCNFKDNNELVRNILLFITFNPNSESIINIDIPSSNDTKADFLLKSKIIPEKYFDIITEQMIYKELEASENVKNYIEKIDLIIEENVKIIYKNYIKENENKLLNLFPLDTKYKNATNSILLILKTFYKYKIKIQMLNNTEIFNKINKELSGGIILDNNLKENISLINDVKVLNTYEQMCYFIVKNFKDNLLIKIPKYNAYTTYYNRNSNSLYKISNFEIYGKIIKRTHLKNEYLNNIIFYMNFSREGEVENLIFIQTTSIKYIKYPIIYEKKVNNNLMTILNEM